ncbi:MAG: 1,4-alpha-glucan branching protein domain-containing protein [Armatimonadota bacterium]
MQDSNRLGNFSLVLHGHIPYVLGHGTWPHGSQMLYEAAADTYLPLLNVVSKLASEGIKSNLTIGLTPVAMEQLDDERFKDWFVGYLNEKVCMAQQNAGQFRDMGNLHLAYLAERWQDHYHNLHYQFCAQYDCDILGEFRRQQDAGNIEVITSAATHGYLPLLHEDASVQAQILQGVTTYEKHMGRRPRGCWLPECAYRPRAEWAPPPHIRGEEIPYLRKGIEEFLSENGFDYFIVDTHLLGGGDPLPVRIEETDTLGKLWGQIRRVDGPSGDYKSPYRPYFVGSQFEDHPPVVALFRDPETSIKVWSGEYGYPGDFDYLDFHKKHIPGDLRYWRVTDERADLGSKDLWSPDNAGDRAREHAGNFLWTVKETLRGNPMHDVGPLVVSPFDAELFGHWWFEGIWWIEHVLRWMAHDEEINVTTPGGYLAHNTPTEAITLPEGSWGAGGGHWVWLNEDVDWTWERIYDAELDMQDLVRRYGRGHDETMQKLMKQAARELLLLQASDWQFLITTKSAPDYAAIRIHSHYSDFKKCADLARRYARGEWIEQEEWDEFGAIQARDNVFDTIDPLWFGEVRHPVG